MYLSSDKESYSTTAGHYQFNNLLNREPSSLRLPIRTVALLSKMEVILPFPSIKQHTDKF